LAIADAGTRIKRSPETIERWEAGQAEPPLAALEALAVFYKRPLAAFFLPGPPEEPPLPSDFRALGGGEAKPLTRKSRLAIREAQRLQRVAGELMQEAGLEMRRIAARQPDRVDIELLATEQRERLGVGLQEQTLWRNPYQALRRWIRAVEAQGLLVFQMSAPVEELRGICLSRALPAAVVLNAADAVHGRIFTLFHEYAHALFGTEAICTPEQARLSGESDDQPEGRCNRFAAALLLPKEAFATQFAHPDGGLDHLQDLAQAFKVSREACLRRALSLGLISWDVCQAKVKEIRQETPARSRKPMRGPRPPQRCLRSRGATFSRLVLQARAQDLLTTSDALDYLSLRIEHLDTVESLLREGP
jgi:Zn-dependent peptidase ImmA (M78 family)